jgi:hypothetical protein
LRRTAERCSALPVVVLGCARIRRGGAAFHLDMASVSCSRSFKVNLIKHLFGRHRHEENTFSTCINWPGQSGKGYQFGVFSLDASFRPLPGVYIYAGQAEDGSWVPIYIAQTRDLHQRLEGHVSVNDAIANGATHIHAHYCSAGQAARCTEEHDLILRWHPVCNDPVES